MFAFFSMAPAFTIAHVSLKSLGGKNLLQIEMKIF